MAACSAVGCTNRPSKKIPGITFHKFPKDAKRRMLWAEALRRPDWKPSMFSHLCSSHFADEMIDRTSLSCVRLRENAVPTFFEIPTTIRRKKKFKPAKTSVNLASEVVIKQEPVDYGKDGRKNLPYISSTPIKVDLVIALDEIDWTNRGATSSSPSTPITSILDFSVDSETDQEPHVQLVTSGESSKRKALMSIGEVDDFPNKRCQENVFNDPSPKQPDQLQPTADFIGSKTDKDTESDFASDETSKSKEAKPTNQVSGLQNKRHHISGVVSEKESTQPEQEMEDDCDVFGKYLADKLKHMDSKTKKMLQKLISDLVYQAENKKLCCSDLPHKQPSRIKLESLSPREEENEWPNLDKPPTATASCIRKVSDPVTCKPKFPLKNETNECTIVHSGNEKGTRTTDELANIVDKQQDNRILESKVVLDKELKQQQKLLKDDAYGEYVALQLRQMDWKTRNFLQKAIRELVFQAELGKFKDTDVTDFEVMLT